MLIAKAKALFAVGERLTVFDALFSYLLPFALYACFSNSTEGLLRSTETQHVNASSFLLLFKFLALFQAKCRT